ncbi:hypothetical protein B0H21DRAFT_133703 [Amylocystis lapponica]|nr:hypothetical protein B0H21DRAFT_133703 [Amylocystis lapponica]
MVRKPHRTEAVVTERKFFKLLARGKIVKVLCERHMHMREDVNYGIGSCLVCVIRRLNSCSRTAGRSNMQVSPSWMARVKFYYMLYAQDIQSSRSAYSARTSAICGLTCAASLFATLRYLGSYPWQHMYRSCMCQRQYMSALRLSMNMELLSSMRLI